MAKHRPTAPTHTLNYLPLGSFLSFFSLWVTFPINTQRTTDPGVQSMIWSTPSHCFLSISSDALPGCRDGVRVRKPAQEARGLD